MGENNMTIGPLQNPDKDITEMLDLYRNIFNHIFNWVVVVDTEGRVILLNKAYCDFLGIPQEEAMGKHVTEVIENTRMHIVVKTQKEEIGDFQKIKGNTMVANRIPIFKNGKLIGAVGTVVFKDLVEMESYVKRVRDMEKEIQFYQEEFKKMTAGYTLEDIIGDSPEIEYVKKMIRKVANTKSNVLLEGESGTGKELAAQAIHHLSPRGEFPLIKVNCAAIPGELLESELFGYEHGAFTGSKKGGKLGKLEMANNSTILLDEIGDMPMNMQVKLLRAIQEKEIERVGGVRSKKLDFRIIASSNQNLKELVAKQQFREDLYYRLNVVKITLPPLREHPSDIEVIARYLIKKLSKDLGLGVTEITPKALWILKKYSWPGNIRELSNVIERALNLMDIEGRVDTDHLPPYLREGSSTAGIDQSLNLKERIQKLERDAIKRALSQTKYNKLEASKLLGISRTSLYKKIEEHGL
jgi:PAS domain S-box-containing protein